MASLAVMGTIALHTNMNHTVQASDLAATEQSNSDQRVNPDFETMNRLLTETALKYDVPPEIVKAIAERESGGWKHFDENGEVVVTEDNGIGIMQITNQANYDSNRLKNDIAYNIEAGVQILNQMFDRTDLPSINGKDRDVLEHWYFAIMAYNGIKPVNSPIEQGTGERNVDAYQEEIYQIMANNSLIDITELPFQASDFQYDSASTQNIKFVTTDYHFNQPFTKTKHSFTTGQRVKATTAVKVRESATTASNALATLKVGEILTITGPFQYEKNPAGKNHFVWYPVKRSNGTEGFVASSYLKLHFKDVSADHYAADSIDYLVDRGILAGVGNDQFGMGQPLTRWQAVLLLNRANHVSLENRPGPGFTDVPKNYKYYNEIAAAVEEGLFGGVSDTTFEPNATLTRSQMAAVLQRLYQFPEAKAGHPFTDVKASAWYADDVARLYASDITGGVTKTQFGPDQKVTREQFAVFMTRSMEWEKTTN